MLTAVASAVTYYIVDEITAAGFAKFKATTKGDESWDVRLPVNRELHFPVSGTDIGPDDQPADIVNKLSSLGIPVSSLTLTGASSDVTYTVVKGDTLSQIAAAKGLTTQELLDRNSWLTDQGRVSADGKYVLIKPGEKLDLAGITFVTKYEYDSIRAKYGDTAADGLGLNVVTTAAYNDWKRDAALSAFNLFGQPAIQQLSHLSLLSPEVQSTINGLRGNLTGLGLTDNMQLSAVSSLGSTSSLSYEIDAAYTESMAWQNPLGGINSKTAGYNPRSIDLAIEDYNENLITSYSTGTFDAIGSAVDSLWRGVSYDTGIGTLQVGGSSGGGNGAALGYNPPPYAGVNFSCPIGIDLGNGTSPLAKDSLSLVSMFNSTAFFDMDGDSYRERTGWVGPDDGLLVIDLAADGGVGGDGVIDKATEVSFKLWSPDATSDLDGLRLAFDSNNDGVFNAQDARFSEFRIWQDQNQNGISEAGELTTLAERGLTAIDVNKPLLGSNLSVWNDANNNGVQDAGEVTGDGQTGYPSFAPGQGLAIAARCG